MDWWRRATRIPLFGLAVSFWLERNTLDSSELSCHYQQQEMAQGEFHRTSFVHNGVRAHDHFIPIPRGFVDHPIVTGCVRGAVEPVDLLPWEGRKNLGGSIEKAESRVVVQQVTNNSTLDRGGLPGCGKTILAQQHYEGRHVWDKRRIYSQDAQKGGPARPQQAKRRGVRFSTLSL